MTSTACRFTLSLLAAVAVACTTSTSEEDHEIRNGAAGGAYVNRVFLLANPIIGENLGSSTNVKYKRCLLTAAHVVSQPLQAMLVYRGEDLTDLDDKEFQNIAGGEIIPDHALERRDLAVLWATNHLTTPPQGGGGGGADAGPGGGGDPGEKRIPLSGWSPWQMVDTIGLGNAQLPANGTPDPNAMSTGAPETATVIGYGQNGNDAQGQGTGDGKLRYGSMDVTHYFDTTQQTHHPAQTGGSYYAVKRATNQSVCAGDSGGPARTSAGVFGVISILVSTDGTCGTSYAGYFTALNRAKVGTEISNWDWVHQAIARVCTKTLGTSVSGQGKVEGNIAPGQEHTEGDGLNNQIRCGTSPALTDCAELVHEGQSITLTATPAAGWRFVEWVTVGTICQCASSTSPTCAIAYDDMGLYDQTMSIDNENCEAVFEVIPSGGDAGDGP